MKSIGSNKVERRPLLPFMISWLLMAVGRDLSVKCVFGHDEECLSVMSSPSDSMNNGNFVGGYAITRTVMGRLTFSGLSAQSACVRTPKM